MTEERMALVELLQKSGDGDFLRAVAEAVLQILMEADVEGLIGAGRHERSADRLNYRNGYRDRSLDTRLGPLSLRIPKLRQGSYFPPVMDPSLDDDPSVHWRCRGIVGGTGRQPDSALIIQDSLKRGLFRENLARPPVSFYDVVSRNKMSCAEVKRVADDGVTRRIAAAARTPLVTLKRAVIANRNVIARELRSRDDAVPDPSSGGRGDPSADRFVLS